MKTARTLIIAASLLIAGSLISQPASPERDLRIPLEKAMSDQRLAKAIIDQVNPSFLSVDRPEYTVKITYRHDTYIIYGRKETWQIFFALDTLSSSAHATGLL